MKNLTKQKFQKKLLAILRDYLTFFLAMSFFNTCCMVLFLNVMAKIADIEFRQEIIAPSAQLTLLNIVVLSLICTLANGLRHRILVTRPVRRITDAARKVMEGDFSVRIEKVYSIDPDDGYNLVIEYFNRMIQELSGMETLRSDFIASVSHELKTPLAVIQNYSTLLQSPGLSEEERREYAKTISRTSRRLADMVSNILKLNKLENQNIYPDTRVYDLGEQLCECLLSFDAVWEEKNLDIRTDIQENVHIKADPELLSLVWNNLISNATKFTDPGGCISLSLKTEGNQAVIRISDTGCGISPEVGKHIFEKFYQGDTSHAAKGNGLGLALVKRVMDITRGDISVASEVGRGSIFTVRLEIEKEANPSKSQSRKEA